MSSLFVCVAFSFVGGNSVFAHQETNASVGLVVTSDPRPPIYRTFSLGKESKQNLHEMTLIIAWSPTGKEFSPSEEFQLSASGIFGWNDGYVSDGHDGLNFFALRAGAERELTKSFSFVVHGTQSWAIDSNPSLSGDLQLKDFFHFGLGLEWSF